MRIAYVLLDPGIGVFGTKGASVHVQEMIRAMRAAGQQVTVFCTRADDQVPADLADLDVRRIRLPRTDAAGREAAIAEASARIAALIDDEGFDGVYERYSLFSRTLALVAGGLPCVLEVNAPLISEQAAHRVLVNAADAEDATTAQFAAATVIACVSPAVADWVAGYGIPRERVLVVPNGVNTDRFRVGPSLRSDQNEDAVEPGQAPAPAVGEQAGRVRAGFVGTLKPWHGTEVLVRALAHAPQVELVICGTGPQEDALRALAAERGVAERVRFLGAVAPESVPSVLAGLDLAVAPYPPGDHYFSPLKVYEYLAAGLPVVASAIGSLLGLLAECGVLVPPGDEDALGAALAALAADPARRRALGEAGRRIAVAEHDWRQRHAMIVTACEELGR
ncbi:MAG: glycosyltransferase [Propioniciclava sp.]|uniref:glycosyltransferase n=1 Tax=Propioniciclava sp. TaxID=2038686 RepID=UPI0039E53750